MGTKSNLLLWFRRIAITEGISFLVLLFIAMPLKYGADIPEVVNYVGWTHGILFVMFLFLAVAVSIRYKKKFLFVIKAFLASILPFGTFVLDKQMKRNGEFN